MQNQMKSQQYWKNQATRFAKYYTNTKRPTIKSYISKFLNTRSAALMLLISPLKNKTLLDVGCGSGIHMELVAPQCKQIVGIDSSEQMLLEAEKKLNKLAKHNWKLQLADVQKLPFPDRRFDGIICTGLLDYVSSPKQVLSECYRVLKEDGFAVFTIPKKPSLFFFLRTPIGNFIKRKIFDLPPINNITNRKTLNILLNSAGFLPLCIKSIWTTMWMVKVIKIKK